MLDTGMPAVNSWSLNLTFFKDDNYQLPSSLSWDVCSDNIFLTWLLISKLLPTKSILSSSTFDSYRADFSLLLGPKLSDRLLSSLAMGISYSSCMGNGRICWLS